MTSYMQEFTWDSHYFLPRDGGMFWCINLSSGGKALVKLFISTIIMGIFGHHHLDPVTEPIAIFEQFVSTEPQTLILKEKVLSVSGDSFDIKLANGEPLLKVHGAWVSISDRKKIEDAQGKHLFDIVKEHLHLHTTYAIKDPHGKKICEVRSNLKCKSTQT